MSINISTSGSFYRWRPAAWLRIGGDDAATFLQGQFTNDLRALANGAAVYGLWLTLKGKVLADSFVFAGSGGEFWVGSYFSPGPVIRERLESHVIADDVTVDDQTSAWAGITIFGEQASGKAKAAERGSAFVFPGRWDRTAHIDCVYRIEEGAPPALVPPEDPGVLVALGEDEIARRRIRAGIPAVPFDIGPADLPNEGGLERDAISYSKGCYLGQEVMARLKSMGQVRRRLLRVAGEGTARPATPAPLFLGAKQVGELRSAAADEAAGWIGLAMVSLLHVKSDSLLSLTSDGPTVVRLLDSP